MQVEVPTRGCKNTTGSSSRQLDTIAYCLFYLAILPSSPAASSINVCTVRRVATSYSSSRRPCAGSEHVCFAAPTCYRTVCTAIDYRTHHGALARPLVLFCTELVIGTVRRHHFQSPICTCLFFICYYCSRVWYSSIFPGHS